MTCATSFSWQVDWKEVTWGKIGYLDEMKNLLCNIRSDCSFNLGVWITQYEAFYELHHHPTLSGFACLLLRKFPLAASLSAFVSTALRGGHARADEVWRPRSLRTRLSAIKRICGQRNSARVEVIVPTFMNQSLFEIYFGSFQLEDTQKFSRGICIWCQEITTFGISNTNPFSGGCVFHVILASDISFLHCDS